MLDANEELISRSVIRKSPLRVAVLTSLLITCCTVDFAQSLTAHWHTLGTLLDANKVSMCVMSLLSAMKFSYCPLAARSTSAKSQALFLPASGPSSFPALPDSSDITSLALPQLPRQLLRLSPLSGLSIQVPPNSVHVVYLQVV